MGGEGRSPAQEPVLGGRRPLGPCSGDLGVLGRASAAATPPPARGGPPLATHPEGTGTRPPITTWAQAPRFPEPSCSGEESEHLSRCAPWGLGIFSWRGTGTCPAGIASRALACSGSDVSGSWGLRWGPAGHKACCLEKVQDGAADPGLCQRCGRQAACLLRHPRGEGGGAGIVVNAVGFSCAPSARGIPGLEDSLLLSADPHQPAVSPPPHASWGMPPDSALICVGRGLLTGGSPLSSWNWAAAGLAGASLQGSEPRARGSSGLGPLGGDSGQLRTWWGGPSVFSVGTTLPGPPPPVSWPWGSSGRSGCPASAL